MIIGHFYGLHIIHSQLPIRINAKFLQYTYGIVKTIVNVEG